MDDEETSVMLAAFAMACWIASEIIGVVALATVAAVVWWLK